MADIRTRSLEDLFGLEGEARIEKSGVRDVFTPHQPISNAEFLFGRQVEVQGIYQVMSTPGLHALVYGERGVGKSSLAAVVALMLMLHKVELKSVSVKRCDRADTFETIVDEPLREVGIDLRLIETATQKDVDAGVNLHILKAGTARRVIETFKAQHSLSPSIVADALKDHVGVLVVDEADAIGNPEDIRKIAELIKLLSDSGSRFKIMVVGIARTGADLTGAHPSVHRCLRETKVERMANAELLEIIVKGSRQTLVAFDDRVATKIVELSAGYPHFTHLMALKCAERAVAADRKRVDWADLAPALQAAVKDAEGTLKHKYDRAVRSANTDKYLSIVAAAASIDGEEFSAAMLRDAFRTVTGGAISQGSLNNYLQRLVAEDGSAILHRVAKGVYRFADPRMSSYARIAKAAMHE